MTVRELLNTCMNWDLVRILRSKYDELTTDYQDAEELKTTDNMQLISEYHNKEVEIFTVEISDYKGIELNIWI